jgi:hypothetical protein
VADNAVVDNSGIQNGLKQVILNINFRTRSQCIAFKVGSYLGTKKVFNIAGFTLRLMPQKLVSTINKHDIKLFCRCFLDMPIGKKKTKCYSYSVLYDYDFGPTICVMLGL